MTVCDNYCSSKSSGQSESEIKLAIKIDIDTLRGYQEGLSALLEVLGVRGLRVSIFFSMGPDQSGRALRRIFRKGFLAKMLRTKAPSTYGIKTLFYGTLLPSPRIAESKPDLLRRAIAEGHDCGVHSWNHVFWQDKLSKMTRDKIRDELTRAFDLFENISGTRATCCAAPGWQVTPDSLSVQDELGLDYASDVRGMSPFSPIMNGKSFRTPQIPSTLPTLDEALGCNGITPENAAARYLDMLRPGLNVHTIHTEMEGGSMRGVLENFLDGALEHGVKFLTLREAVSAAMSKGNLPISEIAMRPIEGRAGLVATQAS